MMIRKKTGATISRLWLAFAILVLVAANAQIGLASPVPPYSDQYGLHALRLAFPALQTTLWPPDYRLGCTFYGVTCDEAGNVIAILIDVAKGPDPIGSNLTQLSSLQSLAFKNTIRNPLDPSVFGLFSLRNLTVSRAQDLLEIPKAVANLGRLERLSLAYTGVRDVSPLLSNSVPLLESLSVTYSEVSELPLLGWRETSLRELDLSGNPLSNLPTMVMPETLERFSCSGCNLSTPSPGVPWFAGNVCLHWLDLSDNGLTYFPVSLRLGTGCLAHVNLAGNELTERTLGLWSIGTLQVLNLSRNAFTTLPAAFCVGARLERLDLSHNALTTLADDCLLQSPITHADFSWNALTVLPNAIAAWNTLVCLDLSHNALSGTLPPTLRQLPATLTRFDLSHNAFVGPLLTFAYLRHATLDLSCNAFETIPNWLFTASDFITAHVDLSENIFTHVPFTLLQPDALHFSLRRNRLETIELADFNWSSKTIDLSLNPKLTGLIPNTFITMATHLNLSGCSFSDFDVSHSNSLIELDLSHNALSTRALQLTFGNQQFKYLSLANNGIRGALPSTFFATSFLPTWACINLSNNFISGTIPTGLYSQTSLQHIDLSNNLLEGAIPNFVNFRLLSSLQLGGNQLNICITDPSLSTNLTSCPLLGEEASEVCACITYYPSCTSIFSCVVPGDDHRGGMMLTPDGLLTPEANAPQAIVLSPTSEPSVAAPVGTTPPLAAVPQDTVPVSLEFPGMPPDHFIDDGGSILPVSVDVPTAITLGWTPPPARLETTLPVGSLLPLGVCWETTTSSFTTAYFGYCNTANDTIKYINGPDNQFWNDNTAASTKPPTIFLPGCHNLSTSFRASLRTNEMSWSLAGMQVTISSQSLDRRCTSESVTAIFDFVSQPVNLSPLPQTIASVINIAPSRIQLLTQRKKSSLAHFSASISIEYAAPSSTIPSSFLAGCRLYDAMQIVQRVRQIENSIDSQFSDVSIYAATQVELPNIRAVPSDVLSPSVTNPNLETKPKFNSSQLVAIILGGIFSVILIGFIVLSLYTYRSGTGVLTAKEEERKEKQKSSSLGISSSTKSGTLTTGTASMKNEDGENSEEMDEIESGWGSSSESPSIDTHGAPFSAMKGSSESESAQASLDSEVLRQRQHQGHDSQDGFDGSDSPVFKSEVNPDDFELPENFESDFSQVLARARGNRDDKEDIQSEDSSDHSIIYSASYSHRPSLHTDNDPPACTIPSAVHTPPVYGGAYSHSEEGWSADEGYSSVTSTS